MFIIVMNGKEEVCMKAVIVGQNKVCLTHLYLLLVWYGCEVMTFFFVALWS